MVKRKNLKLFSILVVVAFSTFFTCAVAHAAVPLKVLSPRHVFLPQGFDSNDNVEVIVDVEMPNSCYYQGKIEFKIEPKLKKIFIRNLAYFNTDQACLPMVKTKAETLKLGKDLSPGNYEVFFENSTHGFKSAGILPVAQNTKVTVDDFLYAPVSMLATTMVNGRTQLKIMGTLTHSCMSVSEIRITARHNDIIEVLPILEKPSGACTPELREYEETIDLGRLNPGRTLIYVRTDEGDSKSIIEEL